MVNGTELLRTWWSISLRLVILHFGPPAPWTEENWKVKAVGGKPSTTTEVKKTLNWLFAQLLLQISSVSTEQSQTCAMNLNQITLNVKSVSLWWCRLRLPTSTPLLKAHNQQRETCCKTISRNLQNFLKIRNCQDCAKMLVSWRSRMDSSSFQLRSGLRLCRQRVDNALNLEILRHRYQEDGIRAHTKIGLVLDAKLCPRQGRYCIDIMIESLFGDQTPSWFALWMVSTNTSQKRQRKYRVRISTHPSEQGNFWQRLNQCQDLLWIRTSMFLFTTVRLFLFRNVKSHDQKTATRNAYSSRRRTVRLDDLTNKICCEFAQVICSSASPILQILRIGLKKRQNGKSDVPVKQRGGWPKNIFKN